MLTAEEVKTLREKVKTEMARRNGNGSLAKYAGSAYDFINTPTKGGFVLAEQGKTVVNPLVSVKDYGDLVLIDEQTPDGVVPSTVGSAIPGSFDTSLIDEVSKLTAETMTGGSTSCRGACSGLCFGACSGECKGCTSSCTGGCGSGCSGGCTGGSSAS